jgi:serine/threonine-protein kinase
MSLAPPANTLAPGLRLDRYELLWPIAEGGMASVWLARLHGKHGFEKLVAVKTILPKFASDPRFVTMFLDEARIASGIEHTNVARILDLGEEHGVLYMAMEWVDGDSLSKLQRTLARGGVALPQGVVLRLIADACAGLHAAHELRGRDGSPVGIVHRDVSPQNILVSAEGMAKIIDFGVAKARDRVSEETSGGAIKGKIQYMAPEQALGRVVDRRADVWAIGAVLYYFFSGRRVYESDSELGTLQLLTSGTAPAPLLPSVPNIIREIVNGALRFDVTQRWANLEIVRRRLEQAMIDLRCVVRPEDVANFIATYAQDRAISRRTTVAKALQAADARAALEKEKPTVASSSGLSEVYGRPTTSLVTAVGVVPGADPRTLVRPPSTETSSATLGSTALDASAPPRRSIGIWFGGVAAVGALAAGAAGLIYVLRSGPAAATASQPVAASAAPAAAPSASPPPPPSPPQPATGASGATAEPAAAGATADSAPSVEVESLPQAPAGGGAAAAPVAKAAPAAAAAPAVGKPAAPRKPAAKRSSALKGSDEADDGF